MEWVEASLSKLLESLPSLSSRHTYLVLPIIVTVHKPASHEALGHNYRIFLNT